MNLSQSERNRVEKDYKALYYDGGEYGVLIESGIHVTDSDSTYIIKDDSPLLKIAQEAKSFIENKQYDDLLGILTSHDYHELTDDGKMLLLNTVIIERTLMDELDDAEDMRYGF